MPGNEWRKGAKGCEKKDEKKKVEKEIIFQDEKKGKLVARAGWNSLYRKARGKVPSLLHPLPHHGPSSKVCEESFPMPDRDFFWVG